MTKLCDCQSVTCCVVEIAGQIDSESTLPPFRNPKHREACSDLRPQSFCLSGSNIHQSSPKPACLES